LRTDTLTETDNKGQLKLAAHEPIKERNIDDVTVNNIDLLL